MARPKTDTVAINAKLDPSLIKFIQEIRWTERVETVNALYAKAIQEWAEARGYKAPSADPKA